MRNVKIKKAPRTGDQKDYALVFNDKAQSTTNTVKPKVGTTMRATNNGNESIEVEGGETVVGDINYDGLLELMSFEGKRHSEGGMNVHIPDGSFIFSDTPALRIKDKEILDMFGMSGKKKHYTPAEISKKFQVNEYIDILKDDNADDISKRTANEMLKKNTEKLAMLAVVQESIKGLPNGIPNFAENVLAGLQQQEMKVGGSVLFQPGGTTGNTSVKQTTGNTSVKQTTGNTSVKQTTGNTSVKQTPTQGQLYWINGRSYIIDIDNPATTWGKTYALKATDYKAKDDKNLIILKNTDFDSLNTDIPVSFTKGTNLQNAKKEYLNLSTTKNEPYELKNIKVGERTIPTNNKPLSYVSKDNTEYTDNIIVKDGKYYYIEKVQTKDEPYQEQQELYTPTSSGASVSTGSTYPIGTIKWKPTQQELVLKELSPEDYNEQGQFTTFKIKNSKPIILKSTEIKESDFFNPISTTNVNNNTSTTVPTEEVVPQSSKTNETYNTVKIIDDPDVQSFKIGGELKKYQNGGDKKQESIDKYGYYKEIPESTSSDVYDLYFGNLKVRYINNKAVAVELKDGTKYKINTEGSFSNVNDPKDVKQFTQYDELPRLTSIANERSVKLDPTQLTNVVNTQAPQRGSIYGIEMTPDQWSDFERRHGQFIEKSTGDNFKDWKTKVEKGDKGTVAKFQEAYNEYIGYEYFKKRDSHKDPYGVDDKLGWITFSAPALYSEIEPEKPVEINTNSTVNVTDNEKVNVDTTTPKLDDPFPKDTPRPIDTWFAPDITNFVGSLTDKINRYEPAMSKLDFVNPDYVLLDPTRQLAANQEQMARFSNQLENSVDPQIALATMLGASGQGFQNAANVLGNVENANVQITNQALNNSAQIENQEIGVNEAARQNYISQMATLNENEDRARNLKKWRVINAYNQGWHNYNKDQMMEQVLFPQVHTDNITGDVSVVPGRDITVPDTYSNLYGMGNSQNPMVSPETLKTYYDQLLNQGFTSDFAENFLLKQMGANKKKNQQSMEEGYSQAMRFGGSFNINDYTNI